MKVLALPDVTRIVVVPDSGPIEHFEKWNAYTGGAELHVQDDGRTLKVFPLMEIPEIGGGDCV